jgi:hypothetical protein
MHQRLEAHPTGAQWWSLGTVTLHKAYQLAERSSEYGRSGSLVAIDSSGLTSAAIHDSL